MKLLLKNATIIDASSAHHGKKRDVLIENGTLTKIAASVSAKDVKHIKLPNLHVSQGWFDSSVSFGEPGYEERETIENGLKTAAKCGFAHVAVNANTNPVTDTKAGIQFLKSKATGNAVSLYPIGALSAGSTAENLAELYDMSTEGAVAFYDFKKSIANANLLKIALQYTQNFDGLVQSFPMDSSVAPKGMVHEGIYSTQLGLKGIPSLAEELQVTRDLYILTYTGGRLHIPTISTKKSVQLIKEAKKKGLNVTCSVAAHNLFLTDEALSSFDTRYKVMPPLRTKEDTKALLKGLKDGTIDGVTSDHNPINIEDKKIEFDHAKYGTIGLESAFGLINNLLTIEETVTALTQLKNSFKIPTNTISEGNTADLTLFTPDGEYTFEKEHIHSTSKNAALLGQELKGKVYGIIANKKAVLSK